MLRNNPTSKIFYLSNKCAKNKTQMILRRLGNKSQIADKIISHFPKHKIYYELFMGTGSVFFKKPKSQYNILNDLDSDVYNLFLIVKDFKEDLINLFILTPMCEDLFYYWKETLETDPVKKALRFLFLSSFSYLGKSDTFRLLHSDCSHKSKLEQLINVCSSIMKNTMLRNKDFRTFFESIYVSDSHIGKKDRFIYAAPPYLDTGNNYNTPKWTKKDVIDLFDTLQRTSIRFAMSEFDHPFILSQAKKRGLNIIEIGERKTIRNRRVEILITNYQENMQMNMLDLFKITKE